MMLKRDVWVDTVKVFACMVVFWGHLIQGLNATQVFANRDLFLWFNKSIGTFQVALFFICSGYLYQKYSCVQNFRTWGKNVAKKLLDLGVPYVTFTLLYWTVKKLIPGAGTNPISSLWVNLVFEPIPPFWYLHTLFWCFLLTPTFANKKVVWGLYVVSVLTMFATRRWLPEGWNLGALGYLITNYQWFLAGMGLAMANPERIPRAKWIPPVLTACFLVLTCVFQNSISNLFWYLCSLLSCSAVVLYSYGKEHQSRFAAFLTPYTMPIFLMHSIFTAISRNVLLRAGITSLWAHVLLGVVTGVGGPILVAEVMKKLVYPEFVLHPRKFIK